MDVDVCMSLNLAFPPFFFFSLPFLLSGGVRCAVCGVRCEGWEREERRWYEVRSLTGGT